jgi:uncharacterized protein DUF4307
LLVLIVPCGYDKSDREDPNVGDHTTAGAAADAALPAGRYGSRGRMAAPRRRLYWLLGACGLVAGIAVAVVGYRNLGSTPIDAQGTSYAVVDPTSMRISFDVTRDEPERPAVCIVRVLTFDGSEGGRREVLVPPGGNSTSVTAVIRSSAKPVTADVFGCSYQVPTYLSKALRPTE